MCDKAHLNISADTFYKWYRRFSEFSDAIKEGRKPVEVEIEDAFYKGCSGYYVTETVEDIKEDAHGKQHKEIRRTKRYIPPSPALIIFALKNLKKNKFKEKPIDDDPFSFDIKDDALSASLRELADALESDAVNKP